MSKYVKKNKLGLFGEKNNYLCRIIKKSFYEKSNFIYRWYAWPCFLL